MKKAIVIYHGCPKNLVLAEKILGILNSLGYRITGEGKFEIAIFLSCGFIGEAKKEAIANLFELIKLKKEKKLKKIIFSGCMASKYGEILKENFREIDEILPPDEIEKYFNVKGKRIISTNNYAYLKIAEGCNHRCSFCIIPFLNGKYRSRPIEEIINEAKEIEEKGIKELILIAQDLTHYGIDLYGKKSLNLLLKKLISKTKFQWIRLLYLYPEEFPLKILGLMKKNFRILPYFDLPFQHVSKKILRMMNRSGSYERDFEIIRKIRSEIPDATIRSTFIVGFPGEKEEDFELLKKFLIEAKLDRVGFFAYSDEPESESFKLKNKVPKKIAKNRLIELAKIQKEISLENHKKFLGKKLEFILEEKKKGVGFGRLKSQAPEIDGYIKIKNLPEGFNGIGIAKIEKVSWYNFFGSFYGNC